MHYGLIILCIIILVVLCFSVERYTSERSEWESVQEGIEEQKTDAERIGVSEGELNAITSTRESGQTINASDISTSETEYSNAQSEHETLLSQADASRTLTEVEHEGVTYTVSANNSDLEKPIADLSVDWDSNQSNANDNYTSFSDTYTENTETGTWEPDDIVAAEPSTSGITAAQWLADYNSNVAIAGDEARVESSTEDTRGNAFVTDEEYAERMALITVDDMFKDMKVVCASTNDPEWNESV